MTPQPREFEPQQRAWLMVLAGAGIVITLVLIGAVVGMVLT